MRNEISTGLVRLYDRAARAGLLDRPLPRRAFESAYLAYKRAIEAGPVDGLREFAISGSTAIDVGANIGFFTLRLARWVGPAGQVIAIEPEARNFASLRRRVVRAGMSQVVNCVQAAAADRHGQLRLAINRGHPGDHHLHDMGELIPAVTLDDLVAADTRPVSLLKIDVQGAEAMVLAGARTLIRAHRPAVFVELHQPSLARLGSSTREVIHTLLAFGYGGHILTRAGIAEPQDPETLVAQSATGYIDVLFLPMSRTLPTGEDDMREHSE
ncbi:MAG: FkbM family methyltransferase [Alphaproteobacteria bacterium]|nr:FkbM family methyltransferase [Alphaproteobacteria bacterium]